MDQIVIEAAKQVPAIAATIFVVVQFLAHLKQITDAFRDEVKEARQAIEANTRALGRVENALDGYDDMQARLAEFRQQHPRKGGQS